MQITPAQAVVTLSVQSAQEYVYSGEDQQMQYNCAATAIEADAPSLEAELRNAIEENEAWTAEAAGSLTGNEAGDYSIPKGKKSAIANLVQNASANFAVRVDWESDAVSIAQRDIRLVSASAAAVYDPQTPLKTDQTAFEWAPEDGIIMVTDYVNGDIVVDGQQADAGIGENTFAEFSGRFAERAHCYNIEYSYGNLIVFPQALAPGEDAPDWDKLSEESREAYEAGDEEALDAYNAGNGFYAGMQVEIHADGEAFDVNAADGIVLPYTGEPFRERMEVRFRDRDGNLLELVEGEDYALTFNGAQEDGPVDVGTARMGIEGLGNYTGRIEVGVEVEPCEITVYVDMTKGEDALENAGNIFPETFDVESINLSSQGEPSCDDANFAVTFIPVEPEEEPWIAIEGWEYDGTDASSHVDSSYGGFAAAHYIWYGAQGEELASPPSDAGTYSVAAMWERWQPAEETTSGEIEFTIQAREITVVADAVAFTYGDGEPDVSQAWHVEGLNGEEDTGDALNILPVLESDESGRHVIAFPVDGDCNQPEQGNYSIIFVPCELTVEPRDISQNGRIERNGDGSFSVYDDRGELLQPDRDYALSVTSAGAGQRQEATAEGLRNYSGTLQAVFEPAPATQVALRLTDADGNPLSTLTLDGGQVSFAGSIETDTGVAAGALRILVDGNAVEADIQPQSDCEFTFAISSLAVPQGTDSLTIQAVWGKDTPVYSAEQTLRLFRESEPVWLCLAITCAIAATVSAIACARLGKRLRKERLKLLDRASRRSNRTIREQE